MEKLLIFSTEITMILILAVNLSQEYLIYETGKFHQAKPTATIN